MADSAAICGPFVAELLERKRMLSHSIYHIHVTGTDGEHFVWRRFKDFVALRDGTSMRAAELPEMPGRICGRRSTRTECLAEILAAVVRCDRHAIMPETRTFLGLGAVSSVLVVSANDLRQALKLSSVQRLGSLAEGDEKEDQEDRCLPSISDFSTTADRCLPSSADFSADFSASASTWSQGRR